MNDTKPNPNKSNDWTIMFFFAADNSLSASMVSQLKAIKDAGFQLNTSVVVHFDPSEARVPTRIFAVNETAKRAARGSQIGDGRDPFVRNVVEDAISQPSMKASKGAVTKELGHKLDRPDKIKAGDALKLFLGYCRENYEASHYMLFLVGHGMIVGSDAFLPDDHPVSGISLKGLGEILRGFTGDIEGDGGSLDLVGLHSCSMSGIEVTYELNGAAKYVMASEGTSFVGSWPYRQLLKKTFNTIEKFKTRKNAKADIVEELMDKLYCLCLHNSFDFTLAGYSADLCLCKLTTDLSPLNAAIRNLVRALKAGLNDVRVEKLILLAHWKSQSYWQEQYTDLFDFCYCLGEACDEEIKLPESTKAAGKSSVKTIQKQIQRLESLRDASKSVTTELATLVVHSATFGTMYQYSHGLSVYFPWSRAISADGDELLKRYRRYAFTTDLKSDSWFSFLEAYLKKTQRSSRHKEDGRPDIAAQPDFGNVLRSFNTSGPLGETLPGGPAGGGKPDPQEGDGCTCPSIKNYPPVPEVSMTDRALRALKKYKK